MIDKKRIAIVGAGIFGSTITIRLAQKGYYCDLYEKKYKINIFEPKIEREIFDHIYLFHEKSTIETHEKSWKLFTPLIKKYLT